MSDPIEEALGQIEIAGQELEEASQLLHLLREQDRKRFTARIRPHWDFYVTAIEERVRRHAARDAAAKSRGVIEALALEVMDLRAQLAHLRGVLVALGVTPLDGCDCPTCGALGGVR